MDFSGSNISKLDEKSSNESTDESPLKVQEICDEGKPVRVFGQMGLEPEFDTKESLSGLFVNKFGHLDTTEILEIVNDHLVQVGHLKKEVFDVLEKEFRGNGITGYNIHTDGWKATDLKKLGLPDEDSVLIEDFFNDYTVYHYGDSNGDPYKYASRIEQLPFDERVIKVLKGKSMYDEYFELYSQKTQSKIFGYDL